MSAIPLKRAEFNIMFNPGASASPAAAPRGALSFQLKAFILKAAQSSSTAASLQGILGKLPAERYRQRRIDLRVH